jgi:hypothetical protein
MNLRPATSADLDLLRHWDEQPHVIASDPNDDWHWEEELDRTPDWRKQLVAEIDGRPIGFIQIIDPAREESHYWGDIAENLRAIDIWIGEATDLGKGTAYQDMVKADLDFVVHLGDYIYEGAAQPGQPRQHDGAEIVTLEQYRNRHALYKTDPDLQAAHAAFPWIVTWDDHEVDNNYASLVPEDDQGQQEFWRRRANAYQAYYEHMPLRQSSRYPRGPACYCSGD